MSKLGPGKIAVVRITFDADKRTPRNSQGDSPAAFGFETGYVDSPGTDLMAWRRISEVEFKRSDGSLELPWGMNAIVWLLQTKGKTSQPARFVIDDGIHFSEKVLNNKERSYRMDRMDSKGSNAIWVAGQIASPTGRARSIEYSIKVKLGPTGAKFSCDPKIVNQPEPDKIIRLSGPAAQGATQLDLESTEDLVAGVSVTGQGMAAGTTITAVLGGNSIDLSAGTTEALPTGAELTASFGD